MGKWKAALSTAQKLATAMIAKFLFHAKFMEFAAMKNRGLKLFNRILNYVGCTNILYGAVSCVCFCRRAGTGAALLGSGGCCPVQSCSLILLFHINIFSSILKLVLFWSRWNLAVLSAEFVTSAGCLGRVGQAAALQQGLCPLLGLAVSGDVSQWHLFWPQGPRACGFCCWGCAVRGDSEWEHPVPEWWRG